jgi:hypothetical protein
LQATILKDLKGYSFTLPEGLELEEEQNSEKEIN